MQVCTLSALVVLGTGTCTWYSPQTSNFLIFSLNVLLAPLLCSAELLMGSSGQDDKKDEGEYVKAGLFLTISAGFGLLAGFGGALSLTRKSGTSSNTTRLS